MIPMFDERDIFLNMNPYFVKHCYLFLETL
jgi:hypothetical protein